jgi:hypothetical protein
MPILSPVQALALDDETRIAADVITAGVHELRRIDESNDRVFAPMLLLSVGFERLLKLTLVLYELARSGKVPSSKALRQHGGRKGHDLAALTSAVVARGGSDEQLLRRPACRDDLRFLREDEVLTYAVATLAEFGTTSRYYHLDTLLDSAGSDTALTGLERLDPLAAWGALEQALVARHHDRSGDSGPRLPVLRLCNRRNRVDRTLPALRPRDFAHVDAREPGGDGTAVLRPPVSLHHAA